MPVHRDRGSFRDCKLLAFPAILVVVSIVMSLTVLRSLRSGSDLLEDFARDDLIQDAATATLFDQMSRNHLAIHALLADASEGVNG